MTPEQTAKLRAFCDPRQYGSQGIPDELSVSWHTLNALLDELENQPEEVINVDEELRVMQVIAEQCEALSKEARMRVLVWAFDAFVEDDESLSR